MPRRLPAITGATLTPRTPAGDALAPIALDSPAWQAWLADAANRSFAFEGKGGGLTARREPRAGVDYWYAYRTVAGRLRKVYLGRGADLTLARLEVAAQQLSAGGPAGLAAHQAPPLDVRPTLTTRLTPPPLRAGIIPRPRLDRLLDAGRACALTLLVAPAGFGKTTLVSQWVEERMKDEGRRMYPDSDSGARPSPFILHPSSFAWLTLAPEDDHPTQLLRNLVAALRVVAPGLGAEALAALAAGAALDTAATVLLNNLAAALPATVLVLDEYHLLHAPAAHALVGFLLDHCPPALRLIIAAREQPPLPLARLRARGQLHELGVAELRFTPAESAAWLRSQVSPDLSDAELAALDARTEGWAAAIQLAALALRGRPDPGALIAALAGSERLVADYLAEEVLASLAPATYAFVLRTALLDELCAELCAALLAVDDPRPLQLLLEDLERRSLFLAPLDAERRWFRYHPLFAATMRARLARELEPAARTALHGRAADWLAAAGIVPPAIGQALLAGRHAQAADLISGLSLGDLLGAIPQAALQAWLAALPEAELRARPRLCLIQAWVLLERHDLAGSAGWVRHAEEARAAAPPDPRGEIALLDAAARLFGGDTHGVTAIRQSLDQLPAEGEELAALMHLLIGIAAFGGGDWAPAHASFIAVGRQARRAGSAYLSAAAGVAQVCVELARGDLAAAAASCPRLIGQLPDRGHLGGLGVLLRLLAREVAREQGAAPDLAAAASLALAGARLDDVDSRILAGVLIVRSALSYGDGALARREAEALTRLSAGERRPLVAEVAAALCAQVALHEADLAGAAGWLQAAPATRPPGAAMPLIGAFMWEQCVLAPLQLRLALAHAGDRAAWPALLDQVDRAAGGPGLTLGLQVRLCLLRALAYAGLEERDRALGALREALTLAAPGGFVAPFREVEPALRALGAWLQEGRPAPPEDKAALRRLSQLLDGDTAPPLAPPALAEPLTAREREVLALLAGGASNRAIAAQLILSEGTVKGYIHSILGKLSAGSRTKAVARARELGLI